MGLRLDKPLISRQRNSCFNPANSYNCNTKDWTSIEEATGTSYTETTSAYYWRTS